MQISHIFARAFTLVEILVVVVILSVLATTVQITLPDNERQRQIAAIEAWKLQIERAVVNSQYRHSRYGLRVNLNSLQTMLGSSGGWGVAENEPRLELPKGMIVTNIRLNGEQHAAGVIVPIVLGQMTPFSMQFVGDDRRWKLAGTPNGNILISGVGFAIHAPTDNEQYRRQQARLTAAITRALQ